jgi:tripartite-type tricarboxylate transporter receptor subunit TctC
MVCKRQTREPVVNQKMMRRIALSALLLVAPVAAVAQERYPEKPIYLVVGFPAGSSVDFVARLLTSKLAESLGRPIVVENVTGAAGNMATDRVAKAAPDGYTLALAANAQIIMNPSLYRLPFDPVKDLVPITQIAGSPNILVVPDAAPTKSFPEMMALAKRQPGALTYASGGIGSSPHMAGALLNSVGGVDIRHIPYKGVVSAMPDLLAGRVTMMFSPVSVVLPTVREGKLRALAVTSLRRSSALPDLPTVDESGLPSFDVTVWYGLLAPAGTPDAIVRKLHGESVKALAHPDLRARLNDLGMDVIGNSPDDFARTIALEIPKWAKVIKESGMSPE